MWITSDVRELVMASRWFLANLMIGVDALATKTEKVFPDNTSITPCATLHD